ncbi:Putative inner membrane protein [Salmonella enterica subsp. arizonae]|nr:Putative inner membrane protein [Salmonella enterica subsp. arizonae]
MTNSASQATCAPFEHSLGIIRQASMEILLLLGIHTAEGKEPRWFMEQLEQARLNLGGWGAVAKKIADKRRAVESVYAATASPSTACSPV